MNIERLVTAGLIPCLRAFRRDLANRHFILIGIAVTVAVASVTAVDTFTDRVRSALAQQSSALLAADLAVIGNAPLNPSYAQQCAQLSCRTAHTLSMRSVVNAVDALQLVELKAVSETYPLRGELLIANRAFEAGAPSMGVPAPGTVWVEQRLLSLVNVSIGDSISIGAQQFSIAKILVLEPDRGGDLFNIAPRVMINIADVSATKLIQPGSRVRYTLLVAGEPDHIQEFRAKLALGDGERIIAPDAARPEIRSALRRAEQYLGLAALTTLILAGIAIALAARSFAERHKDTVALLRTLGASRRYVLGYFFTEIALLGVMTATLGAGVGLGVQELIAQALSGWVQGELPAASAITGVRAASTALIALTGFALPPLLQLRNVPPVRVLRSDAQATAPSRWTLVIYACASSLFIAPWGDKEWSVTAWSLVGLSVGVLVLVLLALVIIKLVGRSRSRTGLFWRFGIANLARRGTLTVVQITALGLGILALLVLGIVRDDLLDTWLTSLPADAPNQFLINIQASDVDNIEAFFAAEKLSVPSIYPMIRGRLQAINDAPITPETYLDPRARRLVLREFNLSSAKAPKPYNKIVAGQWWRSDDDGEFSVEVDIAKTLGITLGDKLTYTVAGEEVSAIVTNLRSVQWDSMQVNFFVESPPALLEEFPSTYITSFRLDPSNNHVLRELVREYPSVTVIDVAALVDHIRAIMDRSAATIEIVFLCTLGAGLLVLIAAIQATQGERVFESALLKTLGAKRATVLRIMAAEFLVIGLAAGAVAGGVALMSAWIIANYVFDLAYAPDFMVVVHGALGGICSVGIVGSVAIFKAMREPAITVLRYST